MSHCVKHIFRVFKKKKKKKLMFIFFFFFYKGIKLLWLSIAELTKPEKPEKFLLSKTFQNGKILIFSKIALLSS